MSSDKERKCDNVALKLMFTFLMQSGFIFLKRNSFPMVHCLGHDILDATQGSNDSENTTIMSTCFQILFLRLSAIFELHLSGPLKKKESCSCLLLPQLFFNYLGKKQMAVIITKMLPVAS